MQGYKDKKTNEEQVVEEPKNEEVKKAKKEKEIKKDKKDKKDEIIEKLENENQELNDKYLRVNAEMQNMRRRMEEEKSHLLKYEGEDFIKQIIPIVDNFERAIDMDDTNLDDEVSKFLSGFKMIYGNLSSILNSYDIKAIDAKGLIFDPNTMEAVMVEENKDFEPNTVIEVLQKGYTYKDKVIRHAMVKVSK